jgi:hypothetical protein
VKPTRFDVQELTERWDALQARRARDGLDPKNRMPLDVYLRLHLGLIDNGRASQETYIRQNLARKPAPGPVPSPRLTEDRVLDMFTRHGDPIEAHETRRAELVVYFAKADELFPLWQPRGKPIVNVSKMSDSHLGNTVRWIERVCREFDLPLPKVYNQLQEVARGRDPSACGILPPLARADGTMSPTADLGPFGGPSRLRPKRRINRGLRTFDHEGQDSWESIGEMDPRYDAMFDAGPEIFDLDY